MTCARREAGAQRPAPSAGSPHKPDPRPGRRRARLFRLLPALALLFGALGLFAAAPASADVLVGNFGVSPGGAASSTKGNANAQGFTTGSAAAGYVLTSIDVHSEGNPNNFQRGNIRAELWSAAAGGGPGALLTSLRVPSSVSVGAVSYAAPADTMLSANTTYYVVLYTIGSFNLKLGSVETGDEDPGGQAGWGIEDAIHWTRSNEPVGSWEKSDGAAIRIRVNGEAVAPTDLTVSVVDRNGLFLVWNAPAGAVTGYDVHYTSASEATAAPDADASGSDPAAAWVDAGHTRTGAWHSIAGLTYGATYRLRVRAVNAVGASDWLHGTKAVPVTVPGKPTQLSVWEGNTRLDINWVAPDTGGSAITGYDVHFTGSQSVDDYAPAVPGQAGGRAWAPRTSSGTTHVIPQLPNGGELRIRVRAKNIRGAGPWVFGRGTPTATPGPRLTGLTLAAGSTAAALTPAFARTKLAYTATVPHDATEVTVTPTWTANGLVVSAASESVDGGTRLSVFGNISSSGGSRTVNLATSGETRVVVRVVHFSSNLWTRYNITVSRAPAPAATPAPPTVPRNVQATPGDGKLTLTWQAPMSWGGWPAVLYTVQWKESSAADSSWSPVRAGEDAAIFQPGPTDTSFTFTGTQRVEIGPPLTVANGTSYDLRISARSRKPGTDPETSSEFLESDWVTVSGTPAAQTVAPPTVPRNVQATPGDGKLTLTWQAPSSWGDGTATAFHAFWKLSSAGDADWQGATIYSAAGTLVPADTSFEFTGEQLDASFAEHIVTNGTAYDLRIRAVSRQSGSNLYSPWVAVYDSVPSTVPRRPDGPGRQAGRRSAGPGLDGAAGDGDGLRRALHRVVLGRPGRGRIRARPRGRLGGREAHRHGGLAPDCRPGQGRGLPGAGARGERRRRRRLGARRAVRAEHGPRRADAPERRAGQREAGRELGGAGG